MKKHPIFSVVVTHYKQPEYWKEAALSVLKQDYPFLQLIVSDDGTPGFLIRDAEQFLQDHLSMRNGLTTELLVRRNAVNLGTAANSDNALKCCKGEYVLFLDGDDVLADKTVLTKFAEEFERLPESENIVAGNYLMCDTKLNELGIRRTAEEVKELNAESMHLQRLRLYKSDPFIIPSATAYKRRVFDLCGSFKNPFVRLCQDGYYFMRLTRMGQRFNVAEFIAAKHRAGGVCNPVLTDGKPPVNSTLIKTEFLRIAEMEKFPYLEDFSQEERDAVCWRYYENLIGYRLATGDTAYGISEPAYSIFKEWAERRGDIPWHFAKSKLHFLRDDEIWHPGENESGVKLERREDCYGCSACSVACPQGAIVMQEDEQGFLYPRVNNVLCVDCGLCSRVCPAQNQKSFAASPLTYYAMKHNNGGLRRRSRSGGAFAAAAMQILREGGVAYGAAYDEDLNVKHIRIDSIDELPKLQGVKYVQSPQKDCLQLASEDLKRGHRVLYSGTPCQIEGLLSLLDETGVPRDNLITIDIVCHGVPSPLVYERYLDYWENKLGAQLKRFDFRDKDKGWRAHVESVCVRKHGREIKDYAKIFSNLFYQHNMFRPSCYSCRFTRYERRSDITVADYWGVENFHADFDDDKGLSLVMPHTPKGEALIQKIKNQFKVIKLRKEETSQPNLSGPSVKGEDYNEFWEDMNKLSMQDISQKWGKYPTTKPPEKKPCHSVGILTFHRAHNYGAMLQAWALKRYLSLNGFEANIIDYRCNRIENDYRWLPWQITPNYRQFKTPDDPKRGIKMYLKAWKGLLPALQVWHKRRRSFIKFLNMDLGVQGRGYKADELDNLKYDAVICGSDQIWVTQDPPYYAAFQGNMRRIAYAASYGNRPFPPEFHPTVYPWLKNFNSVSVREKGMVSVLEDAFGITADAVTLDPTLLLNAEDYAPLLDNDTPLRQRRYLLCYCVLESDVMVNLAKKLAEKNNLELIVIRHFIRSDAEGQIQEGQAGPREFLDYIRCAQLVVTNSFHGTVFSILFDRPFYSVYADGENDRIDGLLDTLGLMAHHLTNELPKDEPNENRDEVLRRLEKSREESYTFLDRALC